MKYKGKSEGQMGRKQEKKKQVVMKGRRKERKYILQKELQ